jgi:hypothetical protein
VSHISGNPEWPLRDEQDLLKDLDRADVLEIQRLQVEATMFLASAISDVAAAIQALSNVNMGLRGVIGVAMAPADVPYDEQPAKDDGLRMDRP